MSQPPATLQIGTRTVPVIALEAFLAGDERRVTTFVSNFGDWELPADAAAVLGTDTGHLEWLHDTGELALFGAVPHRGQAEATLDAPAAAADELAGLVPGSGSSPISVERGTDSGAVRVLFSSEVVAPTTPVALLGVVERGPRVHELLWGWHRRHRSADGWDWLVGRLEGLADGG
jgi:hypothetical protein